MPSEDEISKLLGRPLTAKEEAAFEAYLDVALEQLQKLLGYSLELNGGESAVRTYKGIEDYRSLIVNPFMGEVEEIKINNIVTKAFEVTETSPFSYEIVFHRGMRGGEKIEVKAKWGFEEYPKGIVLLLANMFDVVANGQTGGGAAQVERETSLSHTVQFDTSKSQFDNFKNSNKELLALYALPEAVRLSAGRILWGSDDDLSGYRPYY